MGEFSVRPTPNLQRRKDALPVHYHHLSPTRTLVEWVARGMASERVVLSHSGRATRYTPTYQQIH